MPLEVCVSSVQDAVKAEAAGAARIELCAALEQGGLTPELHEVEEASRFLKIPFRVMIRCRPGNFVYSQAEMVLMEQQTSEAKQSGADGIVFGSLLEDGSVDKTSLTHIIKTAYPLPVTFHRAFDECKDPFTAVHSIIECGCRTLLTSGLQPFAWQGLSLIKKLQQQFGNKIEIMPGSGIHDSNAEEIIRTTGVKWIHASARVDAATGKIMSEEMIRKIITVLSAMKNTQQDNLFQDR